MLKFGKLLCHKKEIADQNTNMSYRTLCSDYIEFVIVIMAIILILTDIVDPATISGSISDFCVHGLGASVSRPWVRFEVQGILLFLHFSTNPLLLPVCLAQMEQRSPVRRRRTRLCSRGLCR